MRESRVLFLNCYTFIICNYFGAYFVKFCANFRFHKCYCLKENLHSCIAVQHFFAVFVLFRVYHKKAIAAMYFGNILKLVNATEVNLSGIAHYQIW